MDVDRVEKGGGKKGKDKKGKGDAKGKGKDKGGKGGQGAPKAKAKQTEGRMLVLPEIAKAKGVGKVQQVQAEDPPPASALVFGKFRFYFNGGHLAEPTGGPKNAAQGSAGPEETDDSRARSEPGSQIILDTGTDASMVPESMRAAEAARRPGHAMRSPCTPLGATSFGCPCWPWASYFAILVHTEQGLSLEEPQGRHHTPVISKHNSLAVVGSIRAITEMPRTLPPRVPRVGKEGMHVLSLT
eukprot:s6517_g5.t1